MRGYAAIVAVLLSTLLRCGNTVPVQGDTHNVANVSKPIISSASVNTPAGGMVFNHVYNINVPPVLCAGADGKVTQTSGTVEVGEGGDGAPFLANTFVPGGGSGGCCNNGGSGSGGDLLNGETGSLVTALQESTEDLKKQLAELLKEFEQFKQSCGCVGAQGQPGVCDPACKYGKCENGRCVCDEGFTGDDCSERACPDNCKDRGDCVNGVCVCKPGFTGADCSLRACVPDCGDRGRCVDGVCQCEPGYEGPTCTSRSCPGNCMGRGVCVDGVCQCEPGFTGPDCSSTSCPNDCFGRGVCVDGVCQCEPGFVGEDCSAELSVPGPITGVFTRDITINSIFIGWVEEDYVDKYHLEYRRTNELNGWNEIEVFDPGYTVTGLASATEYQFRVSGENVKGRGEPSEVVEVATKGPELLDPSPPRDARGHSVDPYSVVVQWKPPVNGSAVISGYRLLYQLGDDGPIQTADMNKPMNFYYVLQDVSPDSVYNMWVVPYSPGGSGPNSERFVVHTMATAGGGTVPRPETGTDDRDSGEQDITKPGAPVGLSGQPVDPYNIHVEWQPPTNPTDHIYGYKLQYQKPGDSYPQTVDMGNPPDRTYILRGVSPDTQYNMWVTPYGPGGDGPESQHLTVQTQPVEGPGTGPGIDGRPGEVTDLRVNLLQYKLSLQKVQGQAQEQALMGDQVWQPPTNPTGPITGYKLQYQKPGDSYPQTVDMGNPPDRSYVLRGVTPDTQYNMWVTPYGPRGDGPESQHLTVQTQPAGGPGTGPGTGTDERPGGQDITNPGAPLGLRGQPVDPYNIHVEWQPPTHPTDTITGYKLQYYKPGDSYPQTVDMGNPPDRSYVLRGVSPDTQYNMWVTPYGPRGDGPDSQHLTVQTQPVEGTGPGTGTDGRPDEVTDLRVNILQYKLSLKKVQGLAQEQALMGDQVWQPPTNPTDTIIGYKVQYQKPGDSYPQTVNMGNPPDHSYVLRGVTPDTQYNMWVTPYGPRGDGPESQHLTVQTQPVGGPGTGPGTGTDGRPGGQDTTNPGAPLGVRGQPVDPYNIHVEWQPPTHPTDTITGYKLQYYKPGDSTPQTVDMGNPPDSSYVLRGVSPDTQYNMWVTPYSPRGDGPESQHLTVQTQPVEGTGPGTGTDGRPGGEVVNPGAPIGVGGHPVDPNTIRLQWRPPTNPTDDIHGYKLHYLKPGDSTLHTVDMGNPPDFTYTLRGVSPDSEYTMLVTPYGPGGRDGPESKPFTVQTQSIGDTDVPTGAVVNPGAPRGVSGMPLNPYTVRVEWRPPTNPTDDIFGYKLHYQKPEDSYPQTVDMGNPPDSTYVLRGVSPDTQYNMWVTPYGPRGDGPQSEPFTVQTQDDPSGSTDMGAPGAPLGVTGLSVDPYTIQVDWQPPTYPMDDISGYRLLYAKEGDTTRETVDMGNPPDLTYNLAGVSPDTQYNMWVMPYGPGGDGPQSQRFTVQTQREDLGSIAPKGAPGAASAVTRDASSLLVEWEAPTLPEGSPDLLGFRLFWRKVGEGEYQTVEVGPEELSYVLMDLDTFTEYEMYVVAFNANGDGPNSDTFTAMTAEGAFFYNFCIMNHCLCMAPICSTSKCTEDTGAPLGVAGEPVSPYSVRIQWRPPTNPPEPVMGYRLLYQRYGDDNQQLVDMGHPDDFSFMLRGLSPGSQYDFWVTPYGNRGDGPRSERVTLQTGSGVPGAPVGLMGEAVDSQSITVRWNEPERTMGVITGYKITYQPEGGAPAEALVPGSDRSHLLTGLTPYTVYTIYVVGLTSQGEGERSDSVTVRTFEGAPARPVGVTANALDARSIQVTWQEPEVNRGVINAYNVYYQPASTTANQEPSKQTVSPYELFSLLGGLQPATEYVISVAAITSAGEGERSDKVTAQTRAGDAPRDFQAEAVDATSIQVSWEPPANTNGELQGYKILYRQAGTEAISIAEVAPAAQYHLLTELQPFTVYLLALVAFTEGGEGETSSEVTVQTDEDVPSPPQDVTVEPIDSTSARVVWQPPAEPNGILQGYKVLYKDSNAAEYITHEVEASEMSYVISDMIPGTEYVVAVSAFTGAGDGSPSEELRIQTEEGVPDVPTSVVAEGIDAQSIRVSWQPSTETNGVLLGYYIYYTPEGSDEEQRAQVEPTDTSYVVGGLQPFTVYIISVSGFTAAGEVPASPTGLGATPVDPRTVRVEWQPPQQPNGEIQGYNIYYRTTESDEDALQQAGAQDIFLTLTGLSPFTEYTIRVSALTGVGEGQTSDSVTVLTPAGAPSFPMDVEANAVDSQSIRINWQPPTEPNGNVLGYNIFYTTEGESGNNQQTVGPDDTTYVIEGLRPATQYAITLNAFTEAGEGERTEERVVTTLTDVPGAPASIDATAVDTTSIRVEWQAPSEMGGTLLGYKIYYQLVGEDSPSTADVEPTETSYLLTELQPYSQYLIWLVGYTEAGEGDSTEQVTVQTPQGVPTAPREVVAVATGPTSATVNWQPPLANNGQLLGYKVYYQNNLDEKVTVTELSASELSHTNDDIEPMTEYLISVLAFTSIGEGPHSQEVTLRTEEGVPAAPTDLQASAVDARTIQVYWQQPQQANGNLLGYKLFYQGFEDEDVTVLEIPSTDTSWLLSGLQPATEYLIWVVAYTGAGDGERPNEVIVQTLEGVPDAPRDIVASATNPTTIRVKWHAPRQTNGVLLGYKVFYKHTADDEIQAAVVAPNKLNHTNIDVDPMTEYVVTVSAFTSAGDGPESRPVTVRTQEGVPSSPFGLYAYALDTDSISISWQLPLDPNGVIEGYNLYYEADGSEDEEMVQVGPEDGVNSPYVLAGLQPYTLYSLEIAGVTGGGEGDRSDQVKVTTLEGVPSTPLSVTADGQAPDTVVVTWQSPAETNGDLLGYYIYYQVVGSTETSQAETGPDETTYSISGLRPATEYIITLTAYTEGGESERSGEALVRTLSGVPSTPLSVTAEENAPDAILVTWEPPTQTNGDLLGYYIYYQVDGDTETSRAEAGPDDVAYIISGLQPATEYIITLTAYTEGGESERSGDIQVRTLSGVPPTPSSVTAEGEAPDSIKVAWQSPAQTNGNLGGFRIYYRILGTSEKSSSEIGPDEMMYSIRGLQPATDYVVTLSSHSDGGEIESERTSEIVVRTLSGAPSTPLGATAEGQAPDTIQVTWQPPTQTNGDLLGYYIYYQVVGSTEESRAEAGPIETTYSISGLQPATEYIITLTAYTEGGESERSGEVLVSTLSGAPSAPLSVSAQGQSPDTVIVAWQTPAETNGDLLGYYVYYQAIGSTEVSRAEAGPDDATYIISGLRPATEYVVTLTAYTEGGESERSGEALVSTLSGAPSTPLSVTAEGQAPDTITVTWQSPAETNGDLLGYYIYYQVVGSTEDVRAEAGPEETTYSISGLRPATEYIITLTAYTEGGESERSGEVLVQTLSGAPGAPASIRASSLGSEAIEVSWQPPPQSNGEILGYRLHYQIVGEESASTQEVEGYETFYLLRGLRPVTEYSIWLLAFTAAGDGERSEQVTVQTAEGVPGAPRDVKGQAVEPTTITVDWQPPLEINGVLLGYKVIYMPENAAEFSTVELGPAELSTMLLDLEPATTYSIVVLAFTSAGDGDESEEILVSTMQGVPGAPTDLSAVETTSNSMKLSWQAPEGDIEGYRVFYSLTGSDTEEAVDTRSADASWSLSGLQPFGEYSISVLAYNSAGDGERSETITVQTEEGVPGAPREVQGLAIDSTTIELQWMPPSPDEQNGVIKGYKILYKKVGEEGENEEDAGLLDLMYTLSDLEKWTEYNIWVSAYTSAGDGLRSPVIVVRTGEDVPGPPIGIEARPGDDSASVLVQWQQPIVQNGVIVGYKILYQKSGDEDVEETDIGTPQLAFTLGGLDWDDYNVWVVAYTGAGDGDRSDPVLVRPAEGVPGPVQSLSGLVWDSQSVQLRWQPPYNAYGQIRGYKVFYQRMGQISPSAEDTQSTGPVYKLTGLKKWTEYIISVAAYTSRGDGMKSNPIIIRTMQDVPGAPEDVQGIAQGSNALRVTWQPPTDRNGVIQGYKVYYARMGTEDYTEIDTQNTELSYELSELRAWTSYTFSVSAYTSVGEGPKSSKVTTRTEEGVPSVGPGNLNAEAVDAGSIRVSWTRISDAEAGGALQGYQVFYQAISADGALEISDAQVYKVEGADTLEATLTGLEAGTRYAITVSGYTSRGTGIRADLVEATTQTGIPYPNPTDCGQVVANGETESGPFTVYPSDGGEPIEVWCDMETDGGGWIVFQRRQDGSVDFWRRWREYRAGFGENTGEFWLGNENIHRLSHQGDYQLRIDLADGTDAVYGEWDNFKLGSESDLYKLNIGEYSGTSGDSLTYHNNRPFSTRDKDNDVALSHCAFAYHGAWWYKNCHRSNLNGQYGDNTHSQGVNWYHWKGHEKSVPFVEMKMRSMDFKTKYARAE
uniref:Uncharacterized protein n=1 Tax=Branchiostoma floridae TaxID=7739 RepID=C3Y2L2_BRAFL|eukprot:XP_002609264.1 hypothetical protein BRAFLDRAFT_124749 [Branchiostoma floridae]